MQQPGRGGLLGLLFISSCSFAQELTLFDPVEADVSPPPVRVEPDRPSTPGISSTSFTLRSISRFGKAYQAVLVARDGSPVQVSWQQGGRSGLEGYSGYTVTGIDASSLTLQQPGGSRCIADEATGISCLDASTARLSLALQTPLAVQQPTPPAGPQQLDTDGSSNATAAVDPFAALVDGGDQMSPEELAGRVERARARADRLRQFQPVRIPDDEVPEGMRVVRTPFGDRLVPDRN